MQAPMDLVTGPSVPAVAGKPRFTVGCTSVVQSTTHPDELEVEFTVAAATGQQLHTPVDIVCVVDESYSMSGAAALNDGNNDGTENAGLSISDIVRHAVKTVINVLGPEDRLSLVGFSSDARRVLELTTMDPAGVATAMAMADDLGPKNNTNLWAGVQCGLDVLHESLAQQGKGNRGGEPVPHRLKTMLLLTDGEPNVEPEGGHIAALDRYLQSHPGLDNVATINTFGFGYSLDSALLNAISVRGVGMYSFIPDASFVGTAFVNAVANLRTAAATGATLTLGGGPAGSPTSKLKVLGWLGDESRRSAGSTVATAARDHSRTIGFGTIQNQQPRHLIARVQKSTWDPVAATATLDCKPWDSAHREAYTLPSCGAGAGGAPATSGSFAAQAARLRFVDAVLGATKAYQATGGQNQASRSTAATAAIKEFVAGPGAAAAAAGGEHAEFVAGLLTDATGQATEALSKDEYFHKWGVHYLPSLAQAHLQQQCNNFKDPGVQRYGDAMFEAARDNADDVFLTLPPPAPSRNIRRSSSAYPSGGGGGSARSSAPVSMSRYHCSGNGCFHGASAVAMAGGRAKRVDRVRKGDVLASGAAVLCVVEHVCRDNAAELVALGDGAGLLITPYHPVRRPGTGEWAFPHTLGPAVSVPCAAVYTFVLDRGHEATINGVACVTLAHGLDDNAVVRHRFFGTDRVAKALAQLPGWSNGWVRIQPDSLVRSRSTGLIVGYAPQPALSPSLQPPLQQQQQQQQQQLERMAAVRA